MTITDDIRAALRSYPAANSKTTRRWCVKDEASWSAGVCPVCDGPGVLSEAAPAGWPRTSHPAAPVAPYVPGESR